MRIAILVYSDFPEGAAMGRRAQLLGAGLSENGENSIQVFVAQRFDDGPLHEHVGRLCVRWGGRGREGGTGRTLDKVLARLNVYRNVLAALDDGLDVLIALLPDLGRWPLLALARQRGVKIGVTYEDGRTLPAVPSRGGRVLAARGRMADVGISNGADILFPMTRRLQTELARWAPHARSCVLPPMVDATRFAGVETPEREAHGPEGGARSAVIGYFGTYWEVEGLEVLLRAVAKLRDEGSECRLIVGGKAHVGHRCDDVGALVAILGLGDRVVETGWLSTKDLVSTMESVDILVMPKRDHEANRLGFPTKLAEYMAMGKPVICSDVGEIRNYVSDGHDIRLCRPDDVGNLASAIRGLLMDGALRAELGRNARVTALREFDYRSVARRALAALTGGEADLGNVPAKGVAST